MTTLRLGFALLRLFAAWAAGVATAVATLCAMVLIFMFATTSTVRESVFASPGAAIGDLLGQDWVTTLSAFIALFATPTFVFVRWRAWRRGTPTFQASVRAGRAAGFLGPALMGLASATLSAADHLLFDGPALFEGSESRVANALTGFVAVPVMFLFSLPTTCAGTIAGAAHGLVEGSALKRLLASGEAEASA